MSEDVSCTRVEELLPWLLNGSLEDDLAQELRAHLAQCARCREALEETERLGNAMAQHLPATELMALAAGEETVLPRRLLVEHLSACADCREELGLVRRGRALVEESVVPSTPPSGGASVTAWRRAAIAASLVAVAFATGWLWTSSNRGAGPPAGSQPVLNLPLVELVPEEMVVRGETGVHSVDLRAGAHTVALLLYSPPGPAYEEYRLEVLDDSGGSLWSGRGLALNPTEDFSVALPASLLGGGEERRLVVSGRRGEEWAPVASYRVRAAR